MKTKNVFLVDDDQTFTFLTSRIVKSTGSVNSLNTFTNGREALNYLVENSNNADTLPDFIFLDLHMPVMDGWEFIEEFKKLKSSLARKTQLYIVTSSIAVHDIERSKNSGVVSEYIIKPVSKEKFAVILQEVN